MRKRGVRMCAIGTVVMLALHATGCAGTEGIGREARGENLYGNETAQEAAEADALQELISQKSVQASVRTSDEDADKEETVYVVADAAGATDRIIVSDWLKNYDGAAELPDVSHLKNIENVRGRVGYTREEDNRIVWAAAGSDIYYRGTTEDALPVSVKVTYYLDGREVSAEEIAGKSGDVRIRFDYENHVRQTAVINEAEEEICVPFLMMSALILDAEHFSGVTVENGEVTSDADRYTVVGMAMPGLQDALNITDEQLTDLKMEREDIDIPDYMEIRAQAKAFELGMTMTVVTTNALDMLGTDFYESDNLDVLASDMDELSDGSTDLVDGVTELKDGTTEFRDGANELRDGVTELKDGTTELRDGVGELRDGTVELRDGVGALYSGTGALAEGAASVRDGAGALASGSGALSEGAATLRDGLGEYVGGVDALAGGIDTVAGAIAQTAEGAAGLQTALTQMRDQAAALTQGTSAMKDALQQMYDELNARIEEIGADQKQIDELNNLGLGGYYTMLYTQRETLKAILDGMQDPSAMTGALDQLVAGATELSAGLNTINTEGMQQLKGGAAALKENGPKLTEGAAALADGSAALYDGASRLHAGTKELSDGAGALFEGVSELSGGVNELTDGVGELYDGVVELDDGVVELNDGVTELYDGTVELDDGVGELLDGVIELDEEGIQKITKLLGRDLQEFRNRISAIRDAGNAYESFSGIREDMKGSVRFLIKTDGIAPEEDS